MQTTVKTDVKVGLKFELIVLNVNCKRIDLQAFSSFSAPDQGRGTTLTANLDLQPWQHFDLTLTGTYANLFRVSDNSLVYDYPIGRVRLTYQLNQYWFVRGITEYNGYRKSLTDDFLLSFTYIPGTVMYLGYGSLDERTAWNQTAYVAANSYLETYRGIFFKMSYLWRS